MKESITTEESIEEPHYVIISNLDLETFENRICIFGDVITLIDNDILEGIIKSYLSFI